MVLSKIDSLGTAFPVSRGHRDTLHAAESDFSYAAAAPSQGPFAGVWIGLVRLSPELEDRFDIHQEIPVVYSPHTDIQGRTIARLGELLDNFPADRRGFAGGAVFFWAPDVRLETKLEKFSRTELVIIPMPSGGEESLVNSLATHLYSQDLYRERTYVTGDQFFGRRSLLAELRGDLANQKVPAVFGTRKTGKTSILKELVRTSAVGGDTDLIEVFIYQDLEHLPRPSSGQDPIPELLGDIAEDIRKELRLRDLRTRELGDLSNNPTLLDFRRALTDILRHPANCQLSVVLILDEIEHLCPPNAHQIESSPSNEGIPQFFGVMRKLVQELDNFTFVVAGLASAIVESGELYGRHNPLFRLASAYYLSPFSRDEAAELLQGIGARLGLTWSPEAIDAAHFETGGQVVLLRELAAQVWEIKRRDTIEKVPILVDDVDSVISSYRRAVRSQINETINHIRRYYPEEYDLCGELIGAPHGFPELADAYPAELNRLINLGLIVSKQDKWVPTQILKLGWGETVKPRSPATKNSEVTLVELIGQGENRKVEFKSSVRVPMSNEVAEIVVVESLVKAVLGFLNAEGGKVLVGVADDGTIIGTEPDVKQSGKSKDKLLRFMTDKFNTYIGQSVCSSLQIGWMEHESHEVICIDVPRSEEPVFPLRRVDGKEDLFVRQNANVVPFAGAELYSYTMRRFKFRT